MNIIGIDVDSKHLVCRLRLGNGVQKERTFDNASPGFKALMRWARQGSSTARVCLEATGVYSMGVATALHEAEGIDVMVVNPKAIKHFATAWLQRSKTDRLDARSIMEYCTRMPFQAWQPSDATLLEIQYLSRRMVQLGNERARERNRLEAMQRLGRPGQCVVRDIEINIRHLQRRIARLEAQALDLIERSERLARKMRLLTSTTGIAHKSAPRLLAELANLPEDMTANQWVAHAGLDPRAYQSGTSTLKPARISKAGNRYLRDALYFPALVASQHDPHVKGYYQHLLARGKKPKQALVAIMRKLLLSIWGMFKHDQPWNGEKFYQPA